MKPWQVALVMVVGIVAITFFAANYMVGLTVYSPQHLKEQISALKNPVQQQSIAPNKPLIEIDSATIELLQQLVKGLIVFLAAAVVLTVVGRITYNAFPASGERKLKQLISQSEQLISQKRHGEAFQLYEQARAVYEALAVDDKAQYYGTMMRAYYELERHAKRQRASYLAEKYSNGTINQEELQELQRLLAEG